MTRAEPTFVDFSRASERGMGSLASTNFPLADLTCIFSTRPAHHANAPAAVSVAIAMTLPSLSISTVSSGSASGSS
eukprot:5775498-Prymnesium_polylepis.1